MTSAITATRLRKSFDAKTSNSSIRLGEVTRGSIVLGTPAGDLQIGIAEGTPARLEVNAGQGMSTTCWRTPPGPKRLTRPSRCAATPPTATSPSTAPDSLPALERKGNHDHQPIPAGYRRGRATTAGQRHRARRRRRHRK